MKPVLVTTLHHGVFVGDLIGHDPVAKTASLANARMVVRWPNEVRGVLGLAATGPLGGSRVSPAVERLDIESVTSVSIATDAARALWETSPWS